MKVLQINSFFSTGGPPRIVKGIYDTLQQNGHSCIVAACRAKPIDEMKTIKMGSPLNEYIHGIKSRLFDAEGLSSKAATKELIREIENYQPEILHLHNLHGYYINYEILFQYIKNTRMPVVWTLHDCWGFTGHCAHFDYIGCEKWKRGCDKCPQKNSYPKSLFVDRSKRNYHKKKNAFCGVKNLTIVTPSHWLGKLAEESFLGEYAVKVIHNGIDLNLFKPTISNFREEQGLKNQFIVLGVAQIWGERKGFNYFIELSKRLDENYKIVMIGLSKKQKKELPINIIGINPTNNLQELLEIYTEADVFVNPTLEDNFPTTNLEALACGTPVITFNTGGSIESIDNTCGIVVEKGNLDGLHNAIEIIRVKKISSAHCLKRAEMFKREDRYKDYIDLYHNVLSQGSRYSIESRVMEEKESD